MFDLVLKNCRAVTPDGVREADVCVSGGKIAEIRPCGSAEAKTVADIDGMYLFPGVVDAHVHFNDPGLPEREDMRSGSLPTYGKSSPAKQVKALKATAPPRHIASIAPALPSTSPPQRA